MKITGVSHTPPPEPIITVTLTLSIQEAKNLRFQVGKVFGVESAELYRTLVAHL